MIVNTKLLSSVTL